jgi:DNA-binding NtrC family response regulator
MTTPDESAAPTSTSPNSPQPLPFQARVLIIDSDTDSSAGLARLLQTELGLETNLANHPAEALDALERAHYSLCLAVLSPPHAEGLELVRRLDSREKPVTTIVIAHEATVDLAVEAVRAGAHDVLAQPLDAQRLIETVSRALQERQAVDEPLYQRELDPTWSPYPYILSTSPQMLSILDLASELGRSNTTVLIEGETGTGKEQIARAIHQASAAMRPGPLVVLNCAALPETLLESELFGHEKGAFTSALAQRQGRFEQADKGTLFLDEVGEIPLSMQVKLLRVLQERRIERVGGMQGIDLDVRVIAATNRSLSRMVKKGEFREDLFYRLNVVRIELPPLRERPGDVPLLVRHFCEQFRRPGSKPKEVSREAMAVLATHAWPGNVRELANVIERACVTCSGKVIGLEHLPADLAPRGNSPTPFVIDLACPLPRLLARITRSIERRYIRKALAHANGHVGHCAKLCGLSRRSITLKLARYKIDRAELVRGRDTPGQSA